MHISDDELGLKLRGRLPADRVAVLDSHLAECPACAERMANLATIISDSDRSIRQTKPVQERRGGARLPCDDAAQLQILRPFSPKRLEVRILNISRGGMRLRLRQAVDAGALIQIRFRDSMVFGEIRYCARAGGEYEAGLHIHDLIPHPTRP